jgi:hypothetical protein
MVLKINKSTTEGAKKAISIHAREITELDVLKVTFFAIIQQPVH